MKGTACFLFLLFLTAAVVPVSSQTTGRIAGTIRDPSNAVIRGAEISAKEQATGWRRVTTSDDTGSYVLTLLPPGLYEVTATAPGFQRTVVPEIRVTVTQTASLDIGMLLGPVAELVVVKGTPPLLESSGPQLGRAVDGAAVDRLPLATRNFTQILTLSVGTLTALPDSTAVGRNTQAISVNGARVTQNNFQINGVEANTMGTNGPILVAVPAPESIQEFKVQTALYDAAYGRAGGANIQLLTRGGGARFHGTAYGYVRNEAFNANNPFLKAAAQSRPVLRRGVFGGALGGPIRPERAFFFGSYQGSTERNGASLVNSISSGVSIEQGLTDDRTAATLSSRFAVPQIHPAALALLNARLPNGRFAIPTPQSDGRYSGSTPSPFREDQFNANLDLRIGRRNALAAKFFFAESTQSLALPSFRGTGPNVPGFGTDQTFGNRILALQDIHAFGSSFFNELRFGYVSNPNSTVPIEPLRDAELGIFRSNAAKLPGLPLIRIAPNSGGVIIGTPTSISPTTPWVWTLADTVSFHRGRHSLRAGAEWRFNGADILQQQFTWGQVDFQSFQDFLAGRSQSSTFGSGVGDRNQRAHDYNFFLQDDWKVRPKLTLNLGLRYEIPLPVYDTRGRLSTFDPQLYQPSVSGRLPAGIVQAGNVAPELSLSELPKGNKYLTRDVDRNNLAPRLGLAWSLGNRVVVRAGYGIFHSRVTFQYASQTATLPPMFALGVRSGALLNDPFFALPPASRFPTLVPQVPLAGNTFDPGLITPYVQQFGTNVQYAPWGGWLLETAYVGSRGLNLFRQVAINQARLATPQAPIIDGLTGAVITTNTPGNVTERAPFQGVTTNSFGQNQTTAQSSYHSLQAGLTARLSRRLQLLASYTYAKSLDNASGAGAGAGVTGIVNSGQVADTSAVLGDQRRPRANRGVSDFDRTQRFVLSSLWELPGRGLFGGWRVSGIVTAMSGLPVDVVDTQSGSFYGLSGGSAPLARPNAAPGQSCRSALTNVPTGFYFNPSAFVRPVVPLGQTIPSSGGSALAGAAGTDLGTLGRNCLRGPAQANTDLSVTRDLWTRESASLSLRLEFFNLWNGVNYANPLSNFNAAQATGGSINANTGEIVAPGSFGRIISTSMNPRIVQFALKLSF